MTTVNKPVKDGHGPHFTKLFRLRGWTRVVMGAESDGKPVAKWGAM
jgi:hypothetical protein